MGGRGVFSYSSSMMTNVADGSPLAKYAVASLNTGIAKGTTPASAIERFRSQLMNRKVEFSAYLDDRGYFHALGSTGKEGETTVAPLSAVAKEKGVTTIIHNHPFGGSDGRKWGGPLSADDLLYATDVNRKTNGRVNRIVATSREGTYSAVFTKPVRALDAASAVKHAEKALSGKKYQSEWALWQATHNAYASEFAKIGVQITFDKRPKTGGSLVTQQTGVY